MNKIKSISIIRKKLPITSPFLLFSACRAKENRYTLSIFHKKEDVIL